MRPRLARQLRHLGCEVQLSLIRTMRRGREIWWNNPRSLLAFTTRLVRAVAGLGIGWWWANLITLVRQTLRTFVRGVPAVAVLALALGLGLGAVTDRFGVILLPLVEQTFLLATLRDGLPLILALLIAARSGSSIAARVGDDRQTRFRHARADAGELADSTLPHLIAGVATGWWFYHLASSIIVAGFWSHGSVSDFIDAVVTRSAFPLDRELPLGRAVAEGSAKTAVFGLLVAWVAGGLGIASNEGRYGNARHRAIALQEAVWESGITAIMLCVLATIVWWNVRGSLD